MGSRRGPAIGRIERALYALFSHRADSARHDRDRDHHRGAALAIDFETYVVRVYALSWLVAVCATAATAGFGAVLSTTVAGAIDAVAAALLPASEPVSTIPNGYVVGGVSIAAGIGAKRATVSAAGTYLRWRANARRVAIERSLPGAVRYLGALAAGSDGRTAMLENVAARDAYGETGTEFERVIETAALTGSLDTGLRTVARETPSREVLSPFLLKFREHASQGSDSLREFLRMESRMLSHQRSRARQRAGGYLKLLAKLFVGLLVVPAASVVGVTAASALLPELSQPVPIPGRPTVRTALVYGGSAFVLAVGSAAAVLITELRPSTYGRSYDRPSGRATLATATTNPASAAVAFAVPAAVAGWLLWASGQPLANAVLFGYAAYGFPVGAVAVKRAQRDDARDREIRDFVHAVAGHVRLGKPFGAAVETVAREIDFGPLGDDIDDLAFRLGLTTGTDGTDTRREALERFADRVGTPLAEQSVGLVIGALDVGSDAETAFETLQTEVGALYHQRKELQSAMFVYVAVGWLTALFVVGLVVGVNAVASEWMTQQLPAAGSDEGLATPLGIDHTVRQFYVVAQSTMLACGWFAGVASRGRYEALLHSSALVAICYAAFAGAGLL